MIKLNLDDHGTKPFKPDGKELSGGSDAPQFLDDCL